LYLFCVAGAQKEEEGEESAQGEAEQASKTEHKDGDRGRPGRALQVQHRPLRVGLQKDVGGGGQDAVREIPQEPDVPRDGGGRGGGVHHPGQDHLQPADQAHLPGQTHLRRLRPDPAAPSPGDGREGRHAPRHPQNRLRKGPPRLGPGAQPRPPGVRQVRRQNKGVPL